eukprot:8240381-Ditylum_brightwellii.AAC.1
MEKVMAVRYMLQCPGVMVTWSTRILGYNYSMLLNSTILSSLLKKNHVAISYHMAREAIVAKIVYPLRTKGWDNLAASSCLLTGNVQYCDMDPRLDFGFYIKRSIE